MQGSNEQPGKWPPQNGSNRGETSTDERLDSGVEFHKKKKKTQADLFHMKEFHREQKRPPNKKGRA